MYPSWHIVEYASTRLISVWTIDTAAAKNADAAPTTARTASVTGARSNRGANLATRNTPAVTIVAAWIRAETGVGASMAFGSQTWKGSWADLASAPHRKSRVRSVSVLTDPYGPRIATVSPAWRPASRRIAGVSSVPNVVHASRTASRRPASPTRFTQNAFAAASHAGFRS